MGVMYPHRERHTAVADIDVDALRRRMRARARRTRIYKWIGFLVVVGLVVYFLR